MIYIYIYIYMLENGGRVRESEMEKMILSAASAAARRRGRRRLVYCVIAVLFVVGFFRKQFNLVATTMMLSTASLVEMTTNNMMASESEDDDGHRKDQQQQEEEEEVIFVPANCTREQLTAIDRQLAGRFCWEARWDRRCDISRLTRCPIPTWYDRYVAEGGLLAQRRGRGGSAVAAAATTTTIAPLRSIYVGCNKAYDAIETMQKWTTATARDDASAKVLRQRYDKARWSDALWRAVPGQRKQKAACDVFGRPRGSILIPVVSRDNHNSSSSSSSSSSTDTSNIEDGSHHNIVDHPVELYCIEPLPVNYHALRSAAKETGIASDGDRGSSSGGIQHHKFHIVNAAISSEDGTARFPAGHDGLLGAESLGLSSCEPPADNTNNATMKNETFYQGTACTDVPVYSLDTFVPRFVFQQQQQQRQQRRIHYLSIDAEGYDFEVLMGSREVLPFVEYLEFEYHLVGMWPQHRLAEAIDVLSEEFKFVCYWAGVDQLWRISHGCYRPQYDKRFWSNVACVNPALVPDLARSMEAMFLKTINATA